ncbi:MAG TPA: caspase family protein [Planctomycetota bacterium]|nr:caspase family protein [Planctomycetota bacterium]HRR79683.1 caspase family protein [Planctomycetota bacterium]
MYGRRLVGATVLLAACLAASGCMIRRGPERVELKRMEKPPILRLGKITEEFTGSWAKAAQENQLGGRQVVTALLRQSEAASLFGPDPANLVADIHMVTNHEDDGPRLGFLALMSICTLGVWPLSYHSEWVCDVVVTLRRCDGSPVAEYPYQAKGTYDILALPLTMFSLGIAALRGPQDGMEVRQRMARKAVADLMKTAEADYDRLAKAQKANAALLASQPVMPPPTTTTPGPAVGGLPAPISRRYAVIVGVSEHKFRGKMGLTDLRYAARDAQALAAHLRSPDGGRFDSVTLLCNQDATTQNVKIALRERLREVQEGDFVVVAWSGHGGPDPRELQRLYLITHDTDPEHMAATAYAMEEFRDDLNRLRARNILVLADTCHAAGITDPTVGLRGPKDNKIVEGLRALEGAAKGPNDVPQLRLIFTSCEAGETSLENANLGGGHGVFTWFFLQAIAGQADRRDFGGNADGVVTLGETIEFTRDQVKRFTQNQQHPDTAGRFDRRVILSGSRPTAP